MESFMIRERIGVTETPLPARCDEGLLEILDNLEYYLFETS